ncbi:heparinase II/III family protein [Paenibacillus sp. GYB004]|uniref:heparinase II/III domain-containing protein n=1 Tax=Paenibacillus sp. GYB004 TaxID=2994393 RepID=UPI002F963385
MVITNAKRRVTLYTPSKIANARANIATCRWARDLMERATAKADEALSRGADFWWSLIPPQSVPRSYATNQVEGSPITGKAFLAMYGPYGYTLDLDEPWTITDPSSGYQFPTNDFAAYYASGLDRHGIFDPRLADRRLLVNTRYPGKGESWGVDDGFGWVDEHGNRWTFVAYYHHFLWKNVVMDVLTGLRDAYLYTGDIRYARTGVILLDRIADVYPDMDTLPYDKAVFLNSHGGDGLGKTIGSIWETRLVKLYASAYDAFYPMMDDRETIDFLAQKARRYGLANTKNTAEAIRLNIENGIIREVYPGVRTARIRGNTGYHQSALAMAAVVLDEPGTTEEWLQFVFQSGAYLKKPAHHISGGNMLASLVNLVDRDGHGDEGSPGYNSGWLEGYMLISDLLSGYDNRPESADLYRNVRLKRMFHSQLPLIMLDRYTAQIGDTGLTGNAFRLIDLKVAVKAYELYREPVMAQVAYFLNGNSAEGIHGDIFSEEADRLAARIRHEIDTHGEWKPRSDQMTGFGFAVLRDGDKADPAFGDTRRDIWMYYGRSGTSHAHRDKLNIGVHAFGLDLSPDLGYPEATGMWPKRHEWENNTISHNTVVVDNRKQKGSWVGLPRHFDDGPQVQLIEVEDPQAYPQTDLYRRTTAMIRVDETNSYTVDFFRIKGGGDHRYSFHGTVGGVSVEGLRLVPQTDETGQFAGTYAGPDVPYGIPNDADPEEKLYRGSGYHYLRNVERDTVPPEQFSVDWAAVDFRGLSPDARDVHLRLTMLGKVDDVALADGVPPQKPTNPPSLKYVIAHRQGNDLESIFSSVIEPYRGRRFIRSIEPLEVRRADGTIAGNFEARAIRIALEGGRSDTVVCTLSSDTEYIVDGTLKFAGFFGVYAEQDDREVFVYANDGRFTDFSGERRAFAAGTVVDFTRELSFRNVLVVELDALPGDGASDTWEDWIGRFVYVANDGIRNAAYRIEHAERLGGARYRLDIGEASLVRQYADADDFSKGYVYDIAEGAAFRIPLSHLIVRENNRKS